MTRRDVIKSGAGLAAILAAGRAPAALVKSMLGARMTIASSGKRLPYDAEVEYLESTGTQWIDTGYRMTSDDMRFECDMMWKSATNNTANFFYGYRFVSAATTTGNMRTFFLYWGAPGGRTAIRYGVTGGLSSRLVNQNTRINVAFDGTSLTVDGIEYNAIASASASPTYGNMYLFDCNTGNYYRADVSRFAGRIYYFKIWQGNVLVRDFIPVRKGAVGYLYDRVTRRLFGNAGTGDFVLGQDVVPVEYIESHGTEYIDTGVVPTTTDSFYCRAQQGVVRDQAFWGLAGVAYCFSNYNAAAPMGNGTYWAHPAIGTGGVNNVNPLGNANWHETLCQPSGIFVDGVQISSQATGSALSPQNSVALFARAVNSAGGGVAKNAQGRISAFRIERNGDPLRKYLPVRVGTDATSWEGAMMDVLTRRVYRNAGTGAFGYGNDK